MIFLDINTFFSPKAGGIRTYHQAKIDWFRRQSEHGYVLIYPGLGSRVVEAGPPVTLAEAYGPAVTRDPLGYRLLLDYFRVFQTLRRIRPRVLEAGDPWLTGLFCLLARKTGIHRGLLVSFYHSDPIPSYLEPWAAVGAGVLWKRLLVGLLARIFYRLQAGYDLTVVSSRAMEKSLRARGVTRVEHMPFGVPALFLEELPVSRSPGPRSKKPGRSGNPATPEIHLLYAGRLDREKGVDLLLAILPRLLSREDVRISVAGRGAWAARFEHLRHPRYTYLGFLDGPAEMRRVYDAHHVLLAPGPYETFGLGVLEAMARGLVVVGPDQGGTAELLREADSPFIFKAGDVEDFHRAAAAAIACDWRRESDLSRDLALRYGSWDQAVGRMVDRYRSLAGG